MATPFEIAVGEKAAREFLPGMGGFTARSVATAVIEAIDRMRGQSKECPFGNEACPRARQIKKES